jgi:hypothetical protein
MARSFEQVAVAMNNRLRATVGKTEEGRIHRCVFQPQLVYREYKRMANKYYCTECGSQIRVTTQKVCPVCGARWHGEPTAEVRYQERGYHMELEAKGKYQLCRVYAVERWTRLNHKAVKSVWEVERFIYAPNGERKVFARGVQCMNCCYDAFSRWSSITLRHEDRNPTYSTMNRYNLSLASYHIKSLSPQWQYKNIRAMLDDYNLDTGVLKIIAYPWAETLLSTGRKELFGYLLRNVRVLKSYEVAAMHICDRHGYKLDGQFGLWLDHVRMLHALGLDTHNPRYVCPEDLRGEHDVILKRYQRKMKERRERMEAGRKAAEMRRREQRDKAYADMVQHWPERMGRILTLQLQGNNLNIRPLQSIDEFKQEGEAMHHCVYSMDYYDYNRRPHCLILSAKDDQGNRLATIEYNTKYNTIEQCRAACNEIPERDSEIRGLIESHRNDFMKLLKAA